MEAVGRQTGLVVDLGAASQRVFGYDLGQRADEPRAAFALPATELLVRFAKNLFYVLTKFQPEQP